METNDLSENSGDLKNNEAKRRDPFWLLSSDWQHNVVDSKEVPELYSRRALFYFTFFGSIVCGGILMFINMVRLKSKDGQLFVVLLSIVYIAVVFAVSRLIVHSSFINLLLNVLVALVLINPFWGRYAGRKTVYKPRSIVTPLIILISLFLISTIILTFYLSGLSSQLR